MFVELVRKGLYARGRIRYNKEESEQDWKAGKTGKNQRKEETDYGKSNRNI